MSKRHILEDSDSDDGGSPTANSGSFFTTEEKQAIEKCNIQISNDQGKYSEEYMSRAIARLGEPPLEMEGGNYHVKKGEERPFFDRDIYLVHGKTSGDDYDVSPSEESILLEIDAVRRSGKAVKNRMFKNKETGGHVIFGAWWNYGLQRLLELSSDKSIDKESLGEYTAVKILRSLFAFITIDLKDIVTPGKLQKLSNAFGIDWVENTKTARRVIDHLGPAHFLDKELSTVEAHLEGLKRKPTPASTATQSIAVAAAGGSPTKPKVDEAAAAKKQSDARKMRIAQMKAVSQRRGALSAIVESGTNNAASPPKAVASSYAGDRESLAQGRETGMSARNDAPKKSNIGFGQKPTSEHGNRKPPPELAVNENAGERRPPAQPTYGRQREGAGNSSLGFPGSNKSDDGWGRNRDEDTTRPPKTKGSWQFARKTLSCNIQIDPNLEEQPVQGVQGNNNRRAHQESGGGAPHRPPAVQDNFSSRDNHSRGQGSRSRDLERRDDRHNYSRSHNYSSHFDDNRSSRLDSHSSDRGRDGRRGDREDYSQSHSRRGDYDRDNTQRDEYRPQRSQDSSTRDYSGSGYTQGSKHSRSPERDDRPQKRFRAPNETSAPVSSTGAGRGRGSIDNRPAWMTQQEQSSTHHVPTGMPINNSALANPGPNAAGMNANYSAPSLNAPSAAPSAAGRGRGRGAIDNRPAWMTQQEQSSTHHVPTGMPINNSALANPGPSAAGMNANYPAPSLNAPSAPPSAAGRGRGRGAIDNRPAWMTQQEQRSTDRGPAVAQQQVPSANNQVHAINPAGPVGGLPGNGRGRGRGRGRGNTLPAWMTNPQNP